MNKIFSMVIGVTLLSAQVANAQVTEADLMATGMPALQAETVYDLATQGTVADDLAIGGDAITFAAAGTISSTGSGNDITINPVDQFIVLSAQDANRALRYSSSSDTALTLSYGDAATGSQTFSLTSLSTDAADNDFTCLTGGGSVDITTAARGAVMCMHGNEATGAGDFNIKSGNAAGSAVGIFAPSADGTITLTTVSTAGALMDATQQLIVGSGLTTLATDLFPASVIARADPNNRNALAALASVNSALGTSVILAKTRATDGDADVVVQDGDAIGTIAFQGSDGAAYRNAASIVVAVDGTPGSSDMPGEIILSTSPDGSATPAAVLTLSAAKAATFTGTITSSATGALGWTVVTGADTACNTTCTSACVFGWDTAAPGALLACTDATSDSCLCAGAS